jgi:DNA invertase Pin-like site-specific DNA recombinase
LSPATGDCNTQENERQDRVVTSSKTEGKRPQKRLTNEQSRDIITRCEGEDPESFQAIAKAMGCSKSTVWRHKQKHLRQTKPMQKEDSQ